MLQAVQVVLPSSPGDVNSRRYVEHAPPPSQDWTPQQLQQLFAQAEYESGRASTVHPSDEDLQLAPLVQFPVYFSHFFPLNYAPYL